MKTTLALGAILCALCLGSNYRNNHPIAYENGLEYCKSIQDDCQDISTQFGLDGKMILAIGFPEACRFSTLQNEAEYSSMLYFSEGNSPDFSIGEFQMKPSFAKEIERLSKSEPCLAIFNSTFQYKNKEGIRVQRMERLLEPDWQIKYLCAMVTYLDNQYGNRFETNQAKLGFYSAAYNYGFQNPFEEIAKWQTKKAFPHGLGKSDANDSYSSISTFFYQNNEL